MKYAAPTTIDEACSLLAGNADAVVFAGATDVVPQMRGGRPEPAMLIDLKKIDRLMTVSCDGDTWRIGAAVPASALTADTDFSSDFPGLTEAAGLIGSDQIQNRSSLGGNLCNASPAADSVPSLVVNDAVAVIASAHGERRAAVAEVVTGPGRTSLAHDEIVVCFELGRPPERTADAYLRLIPRTEMDIAVVGAAVRLTLGPDSTVSDAAVALGAVAPTVVRVPAAQTALVGSRLDDAALAAAAESASAACNPIDDKRGTVAYRRQVAGVLTRRAAGIAAERIRTADGQPRRQPNHSEPNHSEPNHSEQGSS
ncbi:FAD binding domain-containing protein [Candidatus Poriferisodalis sp.]|uniref:FAD binding domain-containing protein n=1 Tax=Candidatus Poriferisodalis sp. TaxID=3101277 RepID=UPI003B028B25